MTTWFTADTHFFHARLVERSDETGRHGGRSYCFNSVEHMNETLIKRWNDRVQPTDKINVLGDFFHGNMDELTGLFARLNGKKRLVVGNHDKFTDPRLLAGFEKVMFWRGYTDHGFTCTHLPMRDEDFTEKFKMNIHGHIHEVEEPTPRHFNVGVDRCGWAPVALEQIQSIMEYRGL